MSKIKHFNVIHFDFNGRRIESYDVMPYLLGCYRGEKKKDRLATFEEFREFVDRKSKYMYWGRCEYEVVVHGWPTKTVKNKIDIYWQIKMNLDLVTKVLMENVGCV